MNRVHYRVQKNLHLWIRTILDQSLTGPAANAESAFGGTYRSNRIAGAST